MPPQSHSTPRFVAGRPAELLSRLPPEHASFCLVNPGQEIGKVARTRRYGVEGGPQLAPELIDAKVRTRGTLRVALQTRHYAPCSFKAPPLARPSKFGEKMLLNRLNSDLIQI